MSHYRGGMTRYHLLLCQFCKGFKMGIIQEIKTNAGVKIAVLKGDIDTKSASPVTEEILPLIEPNSKIILDMTGVQYMSSAGLRMLLSVFRQSEAKDGKLVLVGLSEDLEDTMSITGFLDFFVTTKTLEEGLEVLSL